MSMLIVYVYVVVCMLCVTAIATATAWRGTRSRPGHSADVSAEACSLLSHDLHQRNSMRTVHLLRTVVTRHLGYGCTVPIDGINYYDVDIRVATGSWDPSGRGGSLPVPNSATGIGTTGKTCINCSPNAGNTKRDVFIEGSWCRPSKYILHLNRQYQVHGEKVCHIEP